MGVVQVVRRPVESALGCLGWRSDCGGFGHRRCSTRRRRLIVFDARITLCARDCSALVFGAAAAVGWRTVSAGTRVRKQLPGVLRGRRPSRDGRVCPSAIGRKVVDGDAKSAENRRRRSDRRCRHGRSAGLFFSLFRRSEVERANTRSQSAVLGAVFGNDLRGGREFRTARSQWRSWREGRKRRSVDDTSGGRSLGLRDGNEVGVGIVRLSGEEEVGMNCVGRGR